MNQMDNNSMMPLGINMRQQQQQTPQQSQQQQYYQMPTQQQPTSSQMLGTMSMPPSMSMPTLTPSASPAPSASMPTQPSGLNFPMPSTAYVNNLIAATNSGSSQQSNANANKFEVVNMTYEDFKSERECRLNASYEALANDFSKITKMNLLDDDNMLYTLMVRHVAFDNKQYCFGALANLYRERYSDLYSKYDSLSVYIEYCLSTIIFTSESKLRSACITNAVRLPNSGNFAGFSKIMRNKRKLETTDGSTLDAKISRRSNNKQTMPRHPFYDSTFYKMKQILFSIGKCTEYCIPAEFSSLSFMSAQSTLNKLDKTTTTPYQGLKLTFPKPLVCILNTRDCKNFTFIDMEHMSNLAIILNEMTGKAVSPTSFSFGTKQKMEIINIADGRTMEKSYTDFTMTLVHNMSIFQLMNNSLVGKSYSSYLYRLDDSSKIDERSLEQCQKLIDQNQSVADDLVDKFEAACEAINSANDASNESNLNDVSSGKTNVDIDTNIDDIKSDGVDVVDEVAIVTESN